MKPIKEDEYVVLDYHDREIRRLQTLQGVLKDEYKSYKGKTMDPNTTMFFESLENSAPYDSKQRSKLQLRYDSLKLDMNEEGSNIYNFLQSIDFDDPPFLKEETRIIVPSLKNKGLDSVEIEIVFFNTRSFIQGDGITFYEGDRILNDYEIKSYSGDLKKLRALMFNPVTGESKEFKNRIK